MLQTTKYQFQSNISHSDDTTQMQIAGDQDILSVSVSAVVNHPLKFRDALLGMRNIITSDFRPDIDPVKREQYFTWLREELQRLAIEEINERETLSSKLHEEKIERTRLSSKLKKLRERETQIEREINKLRNQKLRRPLIQINQEIRKFVKNRRIGATIQQAQLKFQLFDPVITVHPDAVVFEGFSLDSSSYVNLKIDHSNFDHRQEPSFGTTNIDFSNEFAYQLGKIRSFNEFLLLINPEGIEVASNQDTYFEKKVDLPEDWVKGFLQVSSSAILEGIEVDLGQIDLFNLITFLKKHPTKYSPKGMIVHLVPGEPILVELEPFNDLLTLNTIYAGDKARHIKIWGRDRIKLLEPIMSYVNNVRLKLLGSGLPFYFSMNLPEMSYQVGFSGWTANSWSTSTLFGAMFVSSSDKADEEIKEYLKNHLVVELDDLYNEFEKGKVNATLKDLFTKGKGTYEIQSGLVRYRILSKTGFPESVITPSLEERNAITLVDTIIFREEGELNYKGRGNGHQMTLRYNEDGNIAHAACTCSMQKKDMRKTGMCSHLIALDLRLSKEGLK